jgi:hypothetical protein
LTKTKSLVFRVSPTCCELKSDSRLILFNGYYRLIIVSFMLVTTGITSARDPILDLAGTDVNRRPRASVLGGPPSGRCIDTDAISFGITWSIGQSLCRPVG